MHKGFENYPWLNDPRLGFRTVVLVVSFRTDVLVVVLSRTASAAALAFVPNKDVLVVVFV